MAPEKIEQLIRAVYKKWKGSHRLTQGEHPDEEDWVCFLEGELSAEESERIKAHLITCEDCAEVLATVARLKEGPLKDLPQGLAESAKNLILPGEKLSAVEIVIMLKEKALEILSTTGDVLVGQEFLPAPVRSRNIKNFKDEVAILKDFKEVRVEVKIENKPRHLCDLIIFVKDKQTNRVLKDLRVTLLKGNLELESYLTSSDRVIFEHLLAGKYTVEISNVDSKIASVLLDIRK